MTRKIGAGSKFIHALFHLDRPSISVVVRTRSEPDHPHQHTRGFQEPGVARKPSRVAPEGFKNLGWRGNPRLVGRGGDRFDDDLPGGVGVDAGDPVAVGVENFAQVALVDDGHS